MRRRDFITLLGGTAAAWPLAARAQQNERTRRIGWLCSFPETSPYANAAIAAFRQGLSALRWVEGTNLRLDTRWFTDGDRYTKDARELVALKPDILVAIGGAATQRLLDATRTIPIVFAHQNDPLARNFVASLARPGGNATGFTHLEYQTCAKWLELLKQLAPQLTRVAAISGNFTSIDGSRQLEAIQAVARPLAVEVSPLEARDAGEIERSITQFARGPNVAYPVDSGFPRCSVLSDRIGAVARADIDGEGAVARATHHQPTGYWEIIKRDNPCKSARRPPAPRLLHIDEPELTG